MRPSIFILSVATVSVYATPLFPRQSNDTSDDDVIWSNTTTPTNGAGGGSGTTNATASGGVTAILGNPTATPNKAVPSGFVGKLLTEDTTVNRFKDLKAALDAGTINLAFDFNPAANPIVKPGFGGQVDLANRANYPFLTGLGLSTAGIFFQPCGLNTPHVHPRATEFFTLVTNTKMKTGFVLENGLSDEFRADLTQYKGTVFPMGSVHWQQNLDCKPAVGIAALNSDDPGTSSVAQNFLVNTSPDVLNAALGFPKEINASNFAKFRGRIPANMAKGIEKCLSKCGISY